jgi:hypothetical protein
LNQFDIGSKTKRVFYCLALLTVIFSFICMVMPAPASAGTPATSLTVKLNDNTVVTYQISDLQNMTQVTQGYSSIDSMPAPCMTAAQGVKLIDILTSAGIDVSSVNNITFKSTDGYAISFTKQSLLDTTRYYYPNLTTCWDNDNKKVGVGTLEGGVQADPILALISYYKRSGSAPEFNLMDGTNALRLCFSQDPDNINAVTSNRFAKWVNEIDVDGNLLPVQITVTLNLSKNSAAAGESVTASGTAPPNDWVFIKVLDSAQNILVFDAKKADANGNYSIVFGIPDGASGVLTVVAGSGSNVTNKTITVTTTSSGSSSGGGGSSATPQAVTSTTGTATVTPSAGGTISLDSAVTVKVPAGALSGSDKVEVKIEKVDTPPAIPSGFKIAGSVYEFSVGRQSSYSFNKSVTLTFTFDSSALGQDEIPAVYYYDEAQGKWVNLGGVVSGSTITVQVDHFTKYTVMAADKATVAPSAVLTDIAGHWAENSIKKLVALGAVGGYPDGSFKPDKSITRAEFVTVLVKAFNLSSKGGKVFADTANHWAKESIAAAASNGIVSGYDGNTFGPNDLISREQMAAMIVRAAKLNTATEGTNFADRASVSGWARNAVAAATLNRVMNGYPDNTFRPGNNATRAEAVTVIANAVK